MKDCLFTTAAIDNIDHNVTATSAQQHFHGTSISLFQHPDQNALPNAITINTTDKSNLTNKLMLPEYYLNIEPVNKGNVTRPMSSINTRDGENTYFPLEENSAWLEKSELIIIDDDQQDMDTKLSWSAFCQGEESSTTRPKVLSPLMPLIEENINSMAMVKHTMKIIKKAVDNLNPGQISIINPDQPVYALGKQVQWQFPHHYGEDKFVFMMGGLHIEMATMSMIGDWLEESGWSDLIANAQEFTSGTSEALLSAFHVKKSRRKH